MKNLARALGLSTDNLRGFVIECRRDEQPIVRALYGPPDDPDGVASVLRLYTLIEDIAHVEVPEKKP